MKKLLILVLIALILTLTIFTIIAGFEIGSVKVLGIGDMKAKNENLDRKIQQATKLANIDFKKIRTDIDESIKEFEDQKTTYEDMIAVSSSENVQSARQIPKYKVEFLWTTIGTHATKEGIIIKMDIVNGTGGEGSYDLRFKANGSYVGISEFITNIEDDSSLGFKIEEFSMKQGSSDADLEATFVCKNVSIENLTQTTQTIQQEDTDENTSNTTNSTDTTNSTSSTNTSNTSNTTSSTNS